MNTSKSVGKAKPYRTEGGKAATGKAKPYAKSGGEAATSEGNSYEII